MAADIKVPTLGESVTTATVARWLKKAGDAVAADEPLVELETDKVTVEVNAPSAGTLGALAADEGAEVEVGALLGTIEDGAAAAAAKPAASSSPAKPPPPTPGPVARPGTPPADLAPHAPSPSTVHAPMPSAAKRMEENGITAGQLGAGSGKDGRVTKGDVLAFLSRPAPAAAQAAPAAARGPGPEAAREERVKMTRLRRTIAARLKEAQHNAAMLTTFNEVDMSCRDGVAQPSTATRSKRSTAAFRLGFMSFFVQRLHASGCRSFPRSTPRLTATTSSTRTSSTWASPSADPNGLVVPVIRDADRLDFAQNRGRDQRRSAGSARDGALKLDDLTGGSIQHHQRRHLRLADERRRS